MPETKVEKGCLGREGAASRVDRQHTPEKTHAPRVPDSSEASVLWCSAFFIVQLSHPYMTTGKTIALTTWTFVGKVMSLLFNILSGLVITFIPRSKRL